MPLRLMLLSITDIDAMPLRHAADITLLFLRAPCLRHADAYFCRLMLR